MSRNSLLPRQAASRKVRLAALWTCTCLALVGAAAIPAGTDAPAVVAEAPAPTPVLPPEIASPAPLSTSPTAAPAAEPTVQSEPTPAVEEQPAAEPEPAAPEPEPEPEPAPAPARATERASRSEVRSEARSTGGDPKSYAASKVSSAQMSCLVPLWERESGWNPWAVNRSSGAYGIPQALGHGHPFDLGDYRAQIDWGLNYISARYGSPCGAWSFWQKHNWY